ncbi:Disheveled-associated activator of morphogenesis, putative [Pediculus humanus corporis]|uniref:Disheveled-associated activator of morphogenesis, putative n=1 Tax=Pediculus humanus subsp. corporis TaxID=121224 RepID=E0VIP0_PEDHC|nr:Disheveled-associated activator of morphogenesis, putative [Pediculus humanus corporis]EEB13246.1 Disheveled-associated activator of morphogenesis, putative [Pediculus humanus corporis]
MTPTQPMPSQEELNAKFAEFEELDLTAPNKASMLSLPLEKKWQIYCSRKRDREGETDLSHLPEHYIERVESVSKLPYPSDNEEEVRSRTRTLDGLKTALRTQPHSFVLRFIDCDGVTALLNFLSSMDFETIQSSIHTSLIGCLKALMNNSNGRAHVLAHPTGLNIIAQSLSTENIKTKIAVLEILGAVCLVPGGHRKVLIAMLHYQKYAFERTRFQSIINDLDKSTGIYRDEVNLKTAIMSFINAVLNYGPGQENLEFRLHLRYEFLMLGIQPIIDKLRGHENETLDRHLDFFEMVRNDDEKELARKFEQEHVDTKSATNMFDLLRKKLSHTSAYPHLLALLQHCLLLPLNYGNQSQHWILFDRIVQQIVLQTESGNNPDGAPITINVKEIVQQLAKEEELLEARKKADDLEKDNLEISNKLAKKEQELDMRLQEKEDMEASLNRIKERLEKETALHIETKQKLNELEYKRSEMEHQYSCEREERIRLEQMVSTGITPDEAKALTLRCEALSNFKPKSSFPPPPPPPPMVPPPPCQNNIGPPPPPPCGPLPLVSKIELPKKNIPQSSNPLKSFNWSKLPDSKLAGTIWTELDDTKLYNFLGLENIDKIFCAYQKNGVPNEGSVEDLRNVNTSKNRSKILSVIDGRRAQNCTILLSKLKMTDVGICNMIMSMDSNDELPLDMVEQLLKFTPSSEEVALLEEHSDEIDSLARADRFLYEIAKIPHYEQRLRSLHFKKKFGISVNEVSPRIKAVMEASRQVARSRRLRKILELVLAFGNYMNRGARGNAAGFRLVSLNRLSDTKSSLNKGTTLLHYLVDLLEKKFKDILKLEEDLSFVREASKVSLGELEKDMSSLRLGLKEVEREVEFHRSQNWNPATNDQFLIVMKEFLSWATFKFSELEDLFQDMKTRFDRAVRLFGEDNTSIQPDDFFGIFDCFLTALNDAKQDNENLKKKKDEEEKRAKQEAELKKRTIDRRSSKDSLLENRNKTGLSNGINHVDKPKDGKGDKGEFDDLISALRTGDVFGEDMAKFKRSRKSRITANNGSLPRTNNNCLNREDSRERVLNNSRRG